MRHPRSPEADALLKAWEESLSGWGIPKEILMKAPETPWTYPRRVFSRRAEATRVTRELPAPRALQTPGAPLPARPRSRP
jgi:hypothetical protein